MTSCVRCGHLHAPSTACPSPVDARIGEILGGKYQILRRLSAGGMGTVYEARHVVVERHFAVKLLHPECAIRPRIVQRFMQEATAVSALASEHLVAVIDFGNASGIPYFVMELLLGQDLRQLLCEYPQLPVPRAVNMALDVCRGLKAAHDAGLVHRDLKPANIFMTQSSSGRDVAKVLDFGAAKFRDAQVSTGEGTLIGTVGYMAPEQVISGKCVDQRADVYSLGVVLYEAIAGRPVYRGGSAEVLYRILHEDPPRLDACRKNLPRGLAEIISRAMAREPAIRYPNVVALAEDLKPFARYEGSGAKHVGSGALELESGLALRHSDAVTQLDQDEAGLPRSMLTRLALAGQVMATGPSRRRVIGGLWFGGIAVVATCVNLPAQVADKRPLDGRMAGSVSLEASLLGAESNQPDAPRKESPTTRGAHSGSRFREAFAGNEQMAYAGAREWWPKPDQYASSVDIPVTAETPRESMAQISSNSSSGSAVSHQRGSAPVAPSTAPAVLRQLPPLPPASVLFESKNPYSVLGR